MTQRRPKTSIEPVDRNEVFAAVAENVRRARQIAGWTQNEFGMALELHIGRPVTQAGVSAIECTADGRRVRCIDTAELVAYSRCLGQSPSWLLGRFSGFESATIAGVSNHDLVSELYQRLWRTGR